MDIERCKRIGVMPDTLTSFKGGNLISAKTDTKYLAFLLLESLYFSKKLNCKTYENVLRMKTQYMKKQ